MKNRLITLLGGTSLILSLAGCAPEGTEQLVTQEYRGKSGEYDVYLTQTFSAKNKGQTGWGESSLICVLISTNEVDNGFMKGSIRGYTTNANGSYEKIDLLGGKFKGKLVEYPETLFRARKALEEATTEIGNHQHQVSETIESRKF
ncbi:MAG: hypothetical protein AABX66_00795 [Nanoarchaeota archaeon]